MVVVVVVVVVILRCAPVVFVVANDERATATVGVFMVAFDIVVCRTSYRAYRCVAFVIVMVSLALRYARCYLSY